MAKYKPYSYTQGQFVPVFFNKQIQPGTFEYTLNYLVDHELDLAIFDDRFRNDITGAPAYDPRILLKVILFAYSRGITSSRKMARCCEENVVFMALSAGSKPHFTTIADFISSRNTEVIHLFLQVLMVCDHQQLIGKKMFAIDGCKLPSNASKEWSGTKADFEKKIEKMETAIKRMVEKHCAQDQAPTEVAEETKEPQYIEKLQKNVVKIKKWLSENDDRKGYNGKPIKSNITDNESAKMKTSKGVIQGYVGVASVDQKNQVIVNAEAFGQGQEHDLLVPTIESIRQNFEAIGEKGDVFENTKLTADSGYHSEKNMEMVFSENIDAYIADPNFRKRDPRFASAERYKELQREKAGKNVGGKMFTTADFTFPEDFSYCVCPAGQRLYRSGYQVTVKNFKAIKFKGPKSACVPCTLRARCLRKPEITEIRQAAAIMAVRSLSAKHINSILREYIGSDMYRYYNVIHWLDLGVSMRRDDARKVARAASS